MTDGWRIAGIAALGLAASAGIAAALAFTAAPPAEPQAGRGWILEARSRMDANRFAEAAHAYEKGLAESRKVARDPQVWCELADALGMAQGGSLKGRPREMIAKALEINPNHPRALEMAGSAAYEAREYDKAVAYWEPLLAQIAAGTREHAELTAAVRRTRERRMSVP